MFETLTAGELFHLSCKIERFKEKAGDRHGVYSEMTTDAAIVTDSISTEYSIRAHRLEHLERLMANAT